MFTLAANNTQQLEDLTAFVSKASANSAANSQLSIKQIQSADEALLLKAEDAFSLPLAKR